VAHGGADAARSDLAGVSAPRHRARAREAGHHEVHAVRLLRLPWTHSLAAAIGWGILFAGVYFLRSRYAAGAVTLFFGVVSHWLFDFFVHRPDLPLWPGGPKVGLGLWNYPRATIIVELVLFTIGVMLYRDATEPLDRTGSVALWSLVIVLLAVYMATAGAKPPGDTKQLAWARCR